MSLKNSADYTERYIFEAEWYDKTACMLKKFYLYYYPADNAVELFDLKTRKTFLRRTTYEGIQIKDFYVGGVVTIFSRCIKITDFADASTKNKLQIKTQKTLALLKPDVIDKMGEILKTIMSHNFQIANIKMINLTKDEAAEVYAMKDTIEMSYIVDYLTSGPVLALELLGDDAISQWQKVIGPEDSEEARVEAPSSLRARYGKDKIHNGIHGSTNPGVAETELNFFFPDSKNKNQGPRNSAKMKNCTCCIIKPHAVQTKLMSQIIDDIQKAGYTISACQQFYVDPVNAEEFLEIYKGVLPDYGAMVGELQSGPCIVLEITHTNQNYDVHEEFRKFCGPMDPDIAKQVRPDTLRAKYGKSKVQNAVHCSDLPEDGLLEVEYFFKIMDGI